MYYYDERDAYEDFWEDHSLSRFHDTFDNLPPGWDDDEEDYGYDRMDDLIDGGYEVGY